MGEPRFELLLLRSILARCESVCVDGLRPFRSKSLLLLRFLTPAICQIVAIQIVAIQIVAIQIVTIPIVTMFLFPRPKNWLLWMMRRCLLRLTI